MKTLIEIGKKLFIIWLAILAAYFISLGARTMNDIHSISLNLERMQ